MIKTRLIKAVPESKKYIAANVVCQLMGLAASTAAVISIADFLQKLYEKNAANGSLLKLIIIVAASLIVRAVCIMLAEKAGFESSRAVKPVLRKKITEKLLRLGCSYNSQTATAEVVQLAGEGVDQLETYFGAYLPQFFYAMLAPVFLFAVTAFFSLKTAVILLICVPLIPFSIVCVQKIAKRLLADYWVQYAKLGDSFLESLQGLTTLKIYQSDGHIHDKINAESERFRRITMKVLTMQLNSVTVMDIFAYGGAAAGIILAVFGFSNGKITLCGFVSIVLLSAEFFLPMRKLGSYFHIAMNGMAASDKIFHLLDLPENEDGKLEAASGGVTFSNVNFSYDDSREILKNISMDFPERSFTAIIGESGCGKSTAAGILSGKNKGYLGSVKIGGNELRNISEKSLTKNVTLISCGSYIFCGTVREVLLMADENVGDEKLWSVLERVRLAEFFKDENGLDTEINAGGANLSGGQRQRLALARGILHDSNIFIFDEATSNIDVESEECILSEIRKMSAEKTVIMITHRLANAVNADRIYAFEKGHIAESGTHSELVINGGVYAKLWEKQSALEAIGGICEAV
ncbi:MAG: ABC transporter ATP-binding protein/permease [Huintestinicola sp.]